MAVEEHYKQTMKGAVAEVEIPKKPGARLVVGKHLQLPWFLAFTIGMTCGRRLLEYHFLFDYNLLWGHPGLLANWQVARLGFLLQLVGDTHGQLNDVLWILYKFGPPSATNVYVMVNLLADSIIIYSRCDANFAIIFMNPPEAPAVRLQVSFQWRHCGSRPELGGDFPASLRFQAAVPGVRDYQQG